MADEPSDRWSNWNVSVMSVDHMEGFTTIAYLQGDRRVLGRSVDIESRIEEGCDHDTRDKNNADLVGSTVAMVIRISTNKSYSDKIYTQSEFVKEPPSDFASPLQHGH